MDNEEQKTGTTGEEAAAAAPEESGLNDGEQADVAGTESGEKVSLPPLDFSTFILSLSSSVLMHLGVVENPVTSKIEKEPESAKQTIDLITLLKDKTRGNLTEEEEKLIDDVLHELRLWYVKIVS